MESTDVLIIGGGPTGVVLALELAAQKIPFRLIDKASSRSDKSRALVVQPRTLELLNRHGIARDLQERGFTTSRGRYCVNGKEAARIEVGEDAALPNTAFPFQKLISQEDTEYFLDECLEKKYGRKVERGLEAQTIVQDADGATATFSNVGDSTGETTTIRAKYVVGCDGSKSVVRQAAGLTFDGESYEQHFILTDTHVEWETPNKDAIMCFGQGVLAVLPLKNGMVRVFASGANVTEREGGPLLEDFQEFFDKMVPVKGKLHDPTWLTRFYLHHRGVNKYSNGRLFVAGDAAHIHSPVGGQGMNTGIQDAVNLGWKLAAVIRKERPASFIDSYHGERFPVGQNLLRGTDRVFTFMSSTNPIFIFIRNLLLPWLLPLQFGNKSRVREMFRVMAEFDITYRDSGFVGTALGLKGSNVRGGDRMLDGKIEGPEGEKYLLDLADPTSYHLMLFSGVGAEAASEGDLQRAETKFVEESPVAAKVHLIFGEKPNGQSGYVDKDAALHKDLGFSQPTYVLLRPDSYIGHVGPLSALDDLINWLK
ncbi:FAD binding domain-containing protein [Annulohypoxylon maeteangense]|uniref:FAD binding domain-containing protein n=1 Tax=Annulohypoxylon maeteangense TaxID=1927788 RepID=UPI002007EBA2|nr:FAD binding domain-containing protein [Annulohypoxylon maeteangense]KAI0883094.1 FAD binding domain-containing protein [Annulohypoxylon maeteangense]